jgi:hypothetical protein
MSRLKTGFQGTVEHLVDEIRILREQLRLAKECLKAIGTGDHQRLEGWACDKGCNYFAEKVLDDIEKLTDA